MTVEEILKEWLKKHGGAGLIHPDDECSCGMNDIPYCLHKNCVPAYQWVHRPGVCPTEEQLENGDRPACGEIRDLCKGDACQCLREEKQPEAKEAGE